MNKLLVIALTILLVGCTTEKSTLHTIPTEIDTIVCVHKYDSKLTFEYNPQHAEKWYSPEYKVNVYIQ